MSTNEPLLGKARKSFENKEYASCLAYFEEASIRYPQWKSSFDFTISFIRNNYPIFKFGDSYEAAVKNVPLVPPDFPSWLSLPPLSGIANDYSHIESEVERYWSIPGQKPTLPVSIIIPVYNRSIEVDFVLAGLVHQTYPRELMEIVITDDGSQEDISAVFSKYSSHFTIKYCRQEDCGYRLSAARNLGVKTASHDSIIILDSDAIPNAELVEKYMKFFHVTRQSAMFGLRHYVSVSDLRVRDYIADPELIHKAPKIKSENNIATKSSAEGFSIDWREALIKSSNLLKDEALPYRFMVGANCAFSREIFNRAGGYSEDFNAWGFEDQEFGYRLLREGAYFIPVKDNYVYHQEPLAGKNDTDRKLGEAVTKKIFVEKCPFIYRKNVDKKSGFEAPLVSIYVPLYNREKYIAECVHSALSQSIKDIEVVICNDGSTDRSVDIVEKYFGSDKRVRLITQKNAGIGAASNTSVRAARGFYIGQLDGDDVLKRDAVEKCLEQMEKNSRLSLVYGTTEYIDQFSNVISPGWNWPVFSREHLLSKMVVHHFRFFRKRDWARTSGFDESIKNAVDYDMMLKLAEVGEVNHVNRVLYQYRRHSEMTTIMDEGEQSLNNFVVINNALKRMNMSDIRAVSADDNLSARSVKFMKTI